MSVTLLPLPEVVNAAIYAVGLMTTALLIVYGGPLIPILIAKIPHTVIYRLYYTEARMEKAAESGKNDEWTVNRAILVVMVNIESISKIYARKADSIYDVLPVA